MALLFTLYEIFKSTKYLGPHLSFQIGQAALRLAWEAIAPDHVDHGEDGHVGHGAPEAQRRHVMQVFEEGARQQ